MRISLRSVYEVITGLKIAINLSYGDKENVENMIKEADEIGAMISGLIKSIKRKILSDS